MRAGSVSYLPQKAIFIITIFLICGSSFAGENAIFVDLDGDGFNDTPPVIAAVEAVNVIAINPDSNKFISFEYSGDKKSELPPACSSYFELRQYESRALIRNRCGLDNDLSFGPGSATGNINLSGAGSICSGGSCHR